MPTLEDSLEEQQDDCQWIVEKAKEKFNNDDRHTAHAWILTAKSLFPFRFIVQYEAFKLHLASNDLQSAAHTLVELCTRFQREEQLQDLIGRLVDEIQNGRGPKEGEPFELQKVFDLLPPASQKAILIGTADNVSDVLWKAKIVNVVLKLFPETVTTLGLDLYDQLTQGTPNNDHREILVTELIPLLTVSPRIILDQPILRSSGISLTLKTSHICQWLEVSASYLTAITVKRSTNSKVHPLSGKSGWEWLYKIFLTVAEKCKWNEIIHSKQIGPHLPAKIRWIGLEHISGFNSSLRVPFEASRTVAIPCFYISVFLFFETAWNYYSHVHQVTESTNKCWALIEDHTDTRNNKKLEDQAPHPIMNLQTGSKSGDVYLENFVVAIDCYNFLHSSNTYRSEFIRLCQQWGTSEWVWLVAFKADMALYKGDIESFRRILQHERQKVKNVSDKRKLETFRILLQLVNAYLLLGDHKTACNLATELISLLPNDSSEGCGQVESRPSHLSGRYLYLLECNASSVLPYVLDLILNTIKDMVYSDSCTDIAIGQYMVLCQYEWKPESFGTLIALIRKRGSFTYNKFFDYIITVDILEEIMYLINHTETKVNIINHETNNSRGRAVTRGTNNKVKEEIMVAMEQQLKRCNEQIEKIIRTFFKQEKLCFVALEKDNTTK